MVNPTTSPLIFSKLLYNIYLPLPIFLPPTNKNYLVIFLNPSPQKLTFLRSLPYILHCKTQGRRCNTNIGYPFLPLPYPVALRGTAHKIEAEAKEKYISTSPLAVSRSIVGHGKEGGFN